MPKTKKNYYESDSEDEAPRQKKRTTKKKKKDPNAPKRPTSAYFFYAGDVRPGIREENPNMKITEVMSQIGAQWRELSDEDKKPYEEQAAKDRKRYEDEMKVYNGNWSLHVNDEKHSVSAGQDLHSGSESLT